MALLLTRKGTKINGRLECTLSGFVFVSVVIFVFFSCLFEVAAAYSLGEEGKLANNFSEGFSPSSSEIEVEEGGGNAGGAEVVKCICDDVCEHLRAEECRHGVTFDMCHCCLVCARGENEPCGGVQGTCAFGLHCQLNEDNVAAPSANNKTLNNAVVTPILSQEGTCSRVGRCNQLENQHGCVVDPEGQCVCLSRPACPGEKIFLFQDKASCESRMAFLIAKKDLEPVSSSVLLTQQTTARKLAAETGNNCSQVKCPPVESCPHDSYRLPSLVNAEFYPRHGMTERNLLNPQQLSCCPSSSTQKCQCIPNLMCSPRECPPGWVAQITRNATGKPGGCCPVLECVVSPPESHAHSRHSPRSHHQNYYNPPQKLQSTDGNSDFDDNSFVDDEDFSGNSEDDGSSSEEVSLENGSLRLLEEDSDTDNGHCYHNGKIYKPGDSWTVQSECSDCFCERGVVSCKPVSCNVPAECRLARTQPLSCCPVCDGCLSASGRAYNTSETWMEDPCTNCTCRGGRIQCHISSCKSHHSCDNPTYYPGECCPRCNDDSPEEGTLPGEKQSCQYRGCHRDISCPNGFRLDESGCPTCECQKCQSLLGCKLSCSKGFQVDHFGCSTCECLQDDQPNAWSRNENTGLDNETSSVDDEDGHDGIKYQKDEYETSSSSSNKGIGVVALFCSVDGVRRVEGEEWSDECRRCVCRHGREMCSLITCPAPKCEHPVLFKGECCPRCPVEDTSSHFKTVNVSICLSSDGTERVEGEMWMLSSCLTCTCHLGEVLCAAPDCPPAPCHSPKLVDCCLQCPDVQDENTNYGKDGQNINLVNIMESSSSFQSNNKNCVSDDSIKTYLNGETWKVGSCQSCRCDAGQIKCFSEAKCPPLNCTRPVLAKNQCCPICLEKVVRQTAMEHHGVEGAVELHHLHSSNSLLNHNLHLDGASTTTATKLSGHGLETHCAVLIACLLVVTILLSLYIVRQVCFHRRASRRLIKKVPVIGFHSSSVSPSVTSDCCYRCDFSKYCGDENNETCTAASGNVGEGDCSTSTKMAQEESSSRSSSANGHLPSEQKPLFHNAPS